MNIQQILIIVAILWMGNPSLAQRQDFNNYKPLRSVGEIPKDFNTSTAQKIENDLAVRRENFTEEEQKEFSERIHQSVDELLQSGLITYGDDISNYVQKVAKNLLKDDLELFNKLRFYTMKSNITNALSTDQGIILVTTGLISQLTSEAELAYVLSHEIVHYTEKHAMQWYEFSTDKDIKRKFQEMSVYSQDREFEADVKGIDMYLKAGYSKEYLTSLFDVLAYSYLPIDEIPFPETYFNTPLCDIPLKKFPKEKFDIKMDENYDDRRSTHPNIKRRKVKALETADTLKNWGKSINLLGIEEFEYVRDVARFERLRSDMLDKAYDQAIYTIFILERKHTNSLYLTRMKCQAWYGLSKTRANVSDDYFDYEYEYDYFEEEGGFGKEGEIAKLQGFLDELKGLETATLAARIVQDCYKLYPEDIEIKELWERTMKQLIFNHKFELEDFSDVTYDQYVKIASEKDTMENKEFSPEEWEKMTKYQKIRSKRKEAEKIKALDSTNYYLYNISDIIKDSAFLKLYEENKDHVEDDLFSDFYDEGFGYDFDDYDMSRKERRQMRKERRRMKEDEDTFGEPIELSEILVVDPYIAQFEGNKLSSEKSKKLEETFMEAFKDIAVSRNLTYSTIGRGNLAGMTTETFNQKCLYVSLMSQLSEYMMQNTFPVDYSELMELEKDKENRKIIFVAFLNDFEQMNYYFERKKSLRERIGNKFRKKENASLYMVIMDPKTQEIKLQRQTVFKKSKNKNDLRIQLEKLLDTKIENYDDLLDEVNEILEEDTEGIPPPVEIIEEEENEGN